MTMHKNSILALTLVLLAGPLMAQNNYLAPAIVYTDDGEDRLVDDEITGGQLAFGYYFSNHFALEGLVGKSHLEGDDNLEAFEVGINALLFIDRNRRLAPYLLLGAGILDTESAIYDNDQEGTFSYGLGAQYRFGDGPVSLRLEHRIRDASRDSLDFDDAITSLGMSFAFGRTDDLPAPPPAPAPDPDSDGDGVPDSRDECPDTPAGYEVDSRGCPLDSDGDGVIDQLDECPNTVRGAPVDTRGCELDDDNDGVVNRLDRCPNTAEGVRVDVNGCEIREVIELPGVNFETNSDRLLPGADNVLRDAAATLAKYPDLVVEVAGHTDSQGAAEYNQGLSERRAATVRDYLINAGAPEPNLSARGYGEADPIADNATADGRARNRRVELRIIQQ